MVLKRHHRNWETIMISVLFLALTGCITGNGEIASELRDIDGFSAVEVISNIPVDVFVDDEVSVEVTCDSNLIDYIRTEVRGDALQVKTPNNRNVRPTTDCFVTVTGPTFTEFALSGSAGLYAQGPLKELRELSASGSGSMLVEAIDSSRLSVSLSGSGDAELDGATGDLELHLSGSGGVLARDLTAGDAEVKISGSGSAEITATGSVDADLSGSGSLDIYGDPQSVNQDTSGSGDVNVH